MSLTKCGHDHCGESCLIEGFQPQVLTKKMLAEYLKGNSPANPAGAFLMAEEIARYASQIERLRHEHQMILDEKQDLVRLLESQKRSRKTLEGFAQEALANLTWWQKLMWIFGKPPSIIKPQ